MAAFRQEVSKAVLLSNSSHIPAGYAFQVAQSLGFSPEELQVTQSQEALQVSDWLLSGSKAALRLAASSSESRPPTLDSLIGVFIKSN